MRRTVAIGMLGTRLDSHSGVERWERWRPTVSLCQHEDLIVDRLELMVDPRDQRVADLVSDDIGSVSPETRVVTHSVSLRDPWDFEEVYGALHEFTRGYSFDPEREDYLVHMTTGTHVAQICLFLLTESRHIPGQLIQTSPPTRSRPREPGQFQVIDLDLSRYDRIAERFDVEHRETRSLLKSGIETRNSGFNELIEKLERVATASTAPILLTGPTGAGKSLLAKRIHELKKARSQIDGPFVEVNCATLRGDSAMSALFGHKKGAFTGAVSDRPGLLLRAHGGLLFLDEIGELGLDEQAMLLRAVEEKSFLPVGADEEVHSDFQLLAGTNRDLFERVASGHFRDDLLARINLWTFALPGLHQRREDIEPNLDYELDQHTQRTGRKVTFNKEARERFLRFALSTGATWAGNFRDLNAAVARMSTLAPGGRIGVETVAEEVERLRSSWSAPGETANQADTLNQLLGDDANDLDRFDRVQLADTVSVCEDSGSLSEAGRRLFAVSRKKKRTANDADRLRKYLARFGLRYRNGRVVRFEEESDS